MSEPRYTLAEARQIIKLEECRFHGHTYDVQVHAMTRKPLGVICTNCGETWRVFHPVDSPTVVVKPIEAPTQVMPRQR